MQSLARQLAPLNRITPIPGRDTALDFANGNVNALLDAIQSAPEDAPYLKHLARELVWEAPSAVGILSGRGFREAAKLVNALAYAILDDDMVKPAGLPE